MVPVIHTARTPLQRLRGLALRRRLRPGEGLRLDGCRSVHTFGMRFALDLVWLDARGRVLRVDRDVGPARMRTCRRARSVIEVAAGTGDAVVAMLHAAAADGDRPRSGGARASTARGGPA